MTFSALDSGLVGPLFTTAEMATCFSDTTRLRMMLATEVALARAQAQLGLAPEGLAAAIEGIALGRLDLAALGRQTVLSGVPTIPFVKAVQACLPPELERSFHKGATTQDILDTSLTLQLRDALALVAGELDAILSALSRLAWIHRETPCVGRTYGQHAAPLSFGFKVAVWLAGVAEAAARLPDIRARLLVASLGGPVGTLATMGPHGPAVLAGFATELGLGTTPVSWHARRGRIVEAGCWLAQLVGALGKMATDVTHLASTEVGEVAEPFVPGRGGSSAMPHKRNPVSCTVILAAQAAAPGHATTLLQAMAAAHERSAGLWHAEWQALPTLFGLASGALRETRALAEGLEVDAVRMRANIDLTRGLLFADAAAARLGSALGRDIGHQLVEQASGEVRASGEPLQAVLSRMPRVQTAGIDLSVAFDLAPAVAAAAAWVEPVIREADAARLTLRKG